MSESLTPHNERKCQVPLVSLVNEAYGKILDHNKGGKLGSLITGMMRAVIAAEKAEAAGNSNFDKNFQNNLSEQSKRREMEADVQYLRYSDTLADVGVRLVNGGGSMAIISGPKDVAIGSGSLYPVVLGSSEEDANKFIDYVSELRPDDDIQLVADVLETTRQTIYSGCKSLYSDDITDDKKKIYDLIGKEIEKFIRIDQAVVDNINLAELLPKRLEEFKKAAAKRSGDSQKYFVKDWLEIYRREDEVKTYRRLEKYVGYYAQNVLPEYVFLGDADREGLKDWSYIDGGIADVVVWNTDNIMRVVEANRSPEAVDYALRYASNFRGGMESTLKDLLERPGEDRPVCQLPGDEDLRTYDSVLKECIDRLNNMENDLKFNDIVADFDQQ